MQLAWTLRVVASFFEKEIPYRENLIPSSPIEVIHLIQDPEIP